LSTAINSNETKTLFRVEPLNCTCCHLLSFGIYGDKREFHDRQSFRSTAIPIQAKAIKRVLISVGLGLSLP
jgi:hypothetical protein